MSSPSTTCLASLTAKPGPDSDRHRNNLIVLLAATDPLDLVRRGHSAVDYTSTADAVLEVLTAGGGFDEIFGLFLSAADRVQAVDAFIRAALTWWEGLTAQS